MSNKYYWFMGGLLVGYLFGIKTKKTIQGATNNEKTE